jgi:hypothetical protein
MALRSGNSGNVKAHPADPADPPLVRWGEQRMGHPQFKGCATRLDTSGPDFYSGIVDSSWCSALRLPLRRVAQVTLRPPAARSRGVEPLVSIGPGFIRQS